MLVGDVRGEVRCVEFVGVRYGVVLDGGGLRWRARLQVEQSEKKKREKKRQVKSKNEVKVERNIVRKREERRGKKVR